MLDVLVVADDLTGANACAAWFARAGLRTVTAGFDFDLSRIGRFRNRFDVVVATTESRHVDPARAQEVVTEAVDAGWPARLVCARIDTTLRGNVGVAAETLLTAVRERSGRRTVGLCVPAYPAAGRTTIDGLQLLDGKRLETTELARDVRSPMTTSSVGEILQRGTDLRIEGVSMRGVSGPYEELVNRFSELLSGQVDVDVIVADAMTEVHIAMIASAAAEAARAADVDLCAIDPGAGSFALADALGLVSPSMGAPILVMSGSATDLTMRQLARLADSRDVATVPVVMDGNLPDIEANVEAIVTAMGAGSPIVMWASVMSRDDIQELSPAEAETMPALIGAIAHRVLQRSPAAGLYTTGGDITSAMLKELEATGIEVVDQALPLAVAGTLVGGPFDGTAIITKGGLIGDESAAIACVDHLDRLIKERRRAVRTA